MGSLTTNIRVDVCRAIICLTAFALITVFGVANAAPTVRLGAEGAFATQSIYNQNTTEFNGAVFTELSRDYRCPLRLSTGLRINSFTVSDLGYLIAAPEVKAIYLRYLSQHFGLIGDIGMGYFISNVAEVDAGFYARFAAGLVYEPYPVLNLRFTLSSMPFKAPTDESFMNVGTGIGATYLFGFPDSDHDRVSDDEDTCLSTPKGARVDRMGCALDTDGDGVFDGFDKCPDTPFEALVDASGCPTDSDGDGIFDGVDRCDDTPRSIIADSTGCPRDTDNDGVPDYMDSCAVTPAGALVDEIGCPKDSDEDGVYDGIDLCPKTPSGFVVNEVGCPFVMPVEQEVIYDAYDTGLNLRAAAMQKLDNIAERLRAYSYRKVEIGVYTDSEGSAPYNVNRGYRVAEKVMEVLIARGVIEEQLELKGYGENNPVASNATEDGKRRNRRIVFQYIGE